MKTFREYCDDRNSKNEGLWLSDKNALPGFSKLDPLRLHRPKTSKPAKPRPVSMASAKQPASFGNRNMISSMQQRHTPKPESQADVTGSRKT